MCKFDRKSGDTRIDPCMTNLIKVLNAGGISTVACCCGHKKYQMSIVVANYGMNFELITKTTIPRKKKFYKRDKQGVYFIPETIKRCDS